MKNNRRPDRPRRTVSHERLESSAPARAACDPTDALPGTAEKIEVLARRAGLRRELHAPGDVISDPTRALAWERRGKFFMVAGVVASADGNRDGLRILTNSTEESFGDRLRRLREARDWPQKVLSRKSGVPCPTISRYENGENLPGMLHLVALADALGVTTDELCGRRRPPQVG